MTEIDRESVKNRFKASLEEMIVPISDRLMDEGFSNDEIKRVLEGFFEKLVNDATENALAAERPKIKLQFDALVKMAFAELIDDLRKKDQDQ